MHMCRPTRGNMAVSAQAALFQAAARKSLSASCCTQVARHLSSSCSVHVALCKFSPQDARRLCLCARCSASAELWRCSAHYTSALQGCDFPVGAARSTLHILRLLCLSGSCRGPGGNRARDRDCESRRANHEITFKHPWSSGIDSNQ